MLRDTRGSYIRTRVALSVLVVCYAVAPTMRWINSCTPARGPNWLRQSDAVASAAAVPQVGTLEDDSQPVSQVQSNRKRAAPVHLAS